MPRRWQIAAASLFLLTGCNRAEPEVEGTPSASPNASILPPALAGSSKLIPPPGSVGVPIGIPADSAGRLLVRDAGAPPPEPFKAEIAPPTDALTQRDVVGVSLQASFAWSDVPAAATEEEVEADAIDAAREKTQLSLVVDLTAVGRMRMELASVGFVLPRTSEIRARYDRFGHLLVWPGASAYRVLVPGTLRAMLAERRPDAMPLVVAESKAAGTGNVAGVDTVRVQLSTSTGTVVLDQAEVPTAGLGAVLLCRSLIELNGIRPETDVCARNQLPVKATYTWSGGGRLVFEVRQVTRRLDLPVGHAYVPPPGAEFKRAELPPQTTGIFLTRRDLTTFRSRPVPPSEPADGAPGEGLYATNRTHELMYLLIDGVPVAWVRPGKRTYLIGPQPGRYTAQWRNFLGTNVQPVSTVHLPASIVLGEEPDAGDEPAAP